MRLSFRAVALTAMLACGHVGTAPPTDAAPTDVTKRVLLTNKLDILLAIDNSAQILDKQTVLAESFPRFVQALDAFPNGRPDLHIGVVNSTVDIGAPGFGPSCASPDPGDDGLLQNAARVTGCSAPTGRFIVDSPEGSGRLTNYTGTLDQALACIAQVGATGCGFEAQLEGMKRALDGSRPENAGFRRPDADLAIIILTDEDDCSAADSTIFTLPDVADNPDFRCQPVAAYDCDPPISATTGGSYTNCTVNRTGYFHDPQDYVKFLATIVDPSQTFVGLLAGDPTTSITTGPLMYGGNTLELTLLPSCRATINGNPALARPGIRLADFRGAYGDRGVFETVCQSDYSGALAAFGSGISTMMSSCLDGNIATSDIDATNPGLQLACTVTDRDAQNDSVGAAIPACPMTGATTPDPAGARPCYWLEAGAAACAGTGPQLDLHVERAGAPDPSIAVTQATCAAQ